MEWAEWADKVSATVMALWILDVELTWSWTRIRIRIGIGIGIGIEIMIMIGNGIGIRIGNVTPSGRTAMPRARGRAKAEASDGRRTGR